MTPDYLIDTHCHLNMSPLVDNIEAVLERAQQANVRKIINPAYDQDSWPEILDLATKALVHPALGLHPWVADEVAGGRQLKASLADAISQASPKVVAIGEIGLDTFIEAPGLAVQLPILETQLELAVDLNLPVILHCRGAFNELLAAMKKHQGRLRGVIHAFTRGPELVQRFHAAGFLFGLGGGVTRDNARRVRRGAKVIPLNRLLLETDAPSIGLQGVRPENTEPRHVAEVAHALAQVRGDDPAVIVRATTENACRLFDLSE